MSILNSVPDNLHAKRMFRFVTNCDTEFMMCECILVENEMEKKMKWKHIEAIERETSNSTLENISTSVHRTAPYDMCFGGPACVGFHDGVTLHSQIFMGTQMCV